MSDKVHTTAQKTTAQVALVANQMTDLLTLFTVREVELSDITAKVLAEKEQWEKEKKMIAATQIFTSKVKVNVGGTIYETSIETMTKFPDSMLGAMFSGRHRIAEDDDGAVFIDRDGHHFREILKFLRNPTSYTTDGLTEREIRELELEADFYLLKKRMFPEDAKLKEVRVQSRDGVWHYLSQDRSGLWYLRGCDKVYPKTVLSYCRHCQSASISASGSWSIITAFQNNRTITPNQPKVQAACPHCHSYGY